MLFRSGGGKMLFVYVVVSYYNEDMKRRVSRMFWNTTVDDAKRRFLEAHPEAVGITLMVTERAE